MSKLSRSELKSIVKECLVEILSEGINNTNVLKKPIKNSEYNSAIKENKINKRKSYLDNINFNQQEKIKKTNIINNTHLTKDPILNELLADTAMTTLQEQVAADHGKNKASMTSITDPIAKHVYDSNPESLFGDEVSGKWAKLAFFDQ